MARRGRRSGAIGTLKKLGYVAGMTGLGQYAKSFKGTKSKANTVTVIKNPTGRKKSKSFNLSKLLTSSSGSTRSHTGVPKKEPKFHDSFPLQQNYFNGRSSLTWVNGTQDYAIPVITLDCIKLKNWYGSNITSNDVGHTDALNDKRFELYIKDIRGSVTFKNHANVQAQVTLYEIIVKRSIDTDPITLLANGTETKFNLSATAPTIYKNVGMHPFLSDQFNSHFKVLKSKKLMLDPGQVHEHTYVYNVNRRFAVNDYFRELNSNNIQYIQGWTRCLMIRGCGTPDTTNDGLTVGSSSGKIIWTQNERVQYRLINQIKERSSVVTAGITTMATERTMGEDTDLVVTVVAA